MRIAASLLCTLLIFGCSPSTKMEHSWRDPTVTVTPATFNKILVAALVKNEATRRAIEDQIVEKLKGKGVASYTMILESDMKKENADALKQKLTQKGVDGALVTRLVNVDKTVEYVPGTSGVYGGYGVGFYGYYGMSWGAYYSPGYYEQNKTYFVETNLFSVKDNKLIWSGTTATTNPGTTDDMLRDIGKTIYYEMRAEGFISKK